MQLKQPTIISTYFPLLFKQPTNLKLIQTRPVSTDMWELYRARAFTDVTIQTLKRHQN